MGRLKSFRDSHPMGYPDSIDKFFKERLHDFLHVCPGNPAGEALKRKLMELKDK